MAAKKTTEIVSEIVELLTPIGSEERIRVVQASLTLLGEVLPSSSRGGSRTDGSPSEIDDGEISSIPTRARTWMKQNGIVLDELQQVFHFENGAAEVVAGELPGKNKKEKTYSAYIVAGLANLLSTGNPTFDDKSGRSLCESAGCYDSANHASTIKGKGNEFTGTKEKGWTLTAPGLKRAASLVKEMTKS